VHGKNLVVALGRVLGFQSHTIELRNIVVGDIPFDGRGDFYLSIECSSNPPMVTALQEEKLPKVIHFPEIITLKVKNSPLEPRVRIVVKELNVLGSNEICDMHISATSLTDWGNNSDPKERTMRFEMRPIDGSIEHETPAWILLEFGEADDVRGIDNFHKENEVRTWVPAAHETVRMSGSQAAVYAANGQDMKDWSTSTRQNVDLKMKPFKGHYMLIDETGNFVQEPKEDDLEKYASMRRRAICMFSFCQCLVYVTIIVYLTFRFYVWSCYRHFKWVTIATLNGKTFPMSTSALHNEVKYCHQMTDGTGVQSGASPCRPNATQVVNICENPPPGPRPGAFKLLLNEYLNIDIDHGVRCFDGICKFRNDLVEWDRVIYLGVFLLFLSTFALRYWLNQRIVNAKTADQKAANKKAASGLK
jgi:hypothetical protein